MKAKIQRELESIVTGADSERSMRLITGFNYYPECFERDRLMILTFGHVHASEGYLDTVIRDLGIRGYPDNDVKLSVRKKEGYFRWLPNFVIRTNGILQENLRIKNLESGEFLQLESIYEETLADAGFSEEYDEKLVAQDSGYELDISFSDVADLLVVAKEFLQKASQVIYDEKGDVLHESEKERDLRNPWLGAHVVPFLIIGGNLEKLYCSISGFRKAKLFRFQHPSVGEYGFVINKRLGEFKESEVYHRLVAYGFKEEECLVNMMFLNAYVDVL